MLERRRFVSWLALAACLSLIHGCAFWKNEAPIARFTADPVEGYASLEVQFDATDSFDENGDVLTYVWEFGDGTTSAGISSTHRYDDAGTYSVGLSIDDGRGGTDAATVEVRVLEPGGDNYALVVGIADYAEGNDLEYTDDDAAAFAEHLISNSAWSSADVTLLLDEQATYAGLVSALEDLASTATSDDLVVIYFSGHGSAQADRPPYDESDGWDETLSLHDGVQMTDDIFAAAVADIRAERILVVLDTCYSGGQITSGIQEAADALPAATGGATGVAEDLVASGNVSLKDLDRSSTYIVALTASSDWQSSWEFQALEHGVFSYYMLRAMEGDADLAGDADGKTSAEECYEYLAPLVIRYTTYFADPQNPQLLDLCPGELVFLE